MKSDDGNVVGKWIRWLGAVLISVLGIVVLNGGLGLSEHPLRLTIGWALVGYGVLRVLLNIWLARRKRRSGLEVY